MSSLTTPELTEKQVRENPDARAMYAEECALDALLKAQGGPVQVVQALATASIAWSLVAIAARRESRRDAR